MRILAFTDPHCDLSAAESIITLATLSKPAAVVCSGDISLFGRHYEAFLRKLSVLKTIYWVPGNHDDGMADLICAEFPFMVDVSSAPTVVSGYVLFGVPGSREYWPDKDFDDSTLNGVLGRWSNVVNGRPVILLSHFPPRGCSVDGTAARTPDAGGSQLVRELVDLTHPRLVVSGHYHSEFGGRSKIGRSQIINPGPNGMIYEVP